MKTGSFFFISAIVYIVILQDNGAMTNDPDPKLSYVVSADNNLAVIAVPVKEHGIVTKLFIVSAKLAKKIIKALGQVVMSPITLMRKLNKMRVNFHAVHLSHETRNHVRTITVDGRGLHWTKVKKLVPSPPSASRTVIGKLMNMIKFTRAGEPLPYYGNPVGPPLENLAVQYPGGPVPAKKGNPIKIFFKNFMAKRKLKKQQKLIKKAQLGKK